MYKLQMKHVYCDLNEFLLSFQWPTQTVDGILSNNWANNAFLMMKRKKWKPISCIGCLVCLRFVVQFSYCPPYFLALFRFISFSGKRPIKFIYFCTYRKFMMHFLTLKMYLFSFQLLTSRVNTELCTRVCINQ